MTLLRYLLPRFTPQMVLNVLSISASSEITAKISMITPIVPTVLDTLFSIVVPRLIQSRRLVLMSRNCRASS